MINDFFELVYPRRCPLCGEIVIPKGEYAHERCKQYLKYIKEPRCAKCGKPVETEEIEYCYDCTTKNYHYERGYSLFLYDDLMKKSIADFKFLGKKEYADFYIDELLKKYGSYINDINPEVLIPVPIHKTKQKERGFNQAEVIAQGISRKMKIPVISDLLIRNKKTLPQKELNDKERLKNLQQAFEINPKKINQQQLSKVLLIDDIYTTGSTIEACTNILKHNGIDKIYFISICIGKGY